MILRSSPAARTQRFNLVLPLFLTSQNKYLAGAFLYSVAVALYLPTNHYHIYQPRYLPFSWVDHLTPFVAHSVWIYLSMFVYFGVTYFLAKNLTNLNKYFYSFLGLYGMSALIFWFFPTTYPRHLYPLPENLDSLTYYAFSQLRNTDTPANCCPSLHVSGVYLAAFIFLDDQRKKFPFLFFWATLISISTLTTKQHYLVDVVGGFLMAALSYFIFHRWVNYEGTPVRKKR